MSELLPAHGPAPEEVPARDRTLRSGEQSLAAIARWCMRHRLLVVLLRLIAPCGAPAGRGPACAKIPGKRTSGEGELVP
ncbi:hypothetical protein M4914_11770 [Streptomyces somaliensis DSM 40738]|uniref:Uncharacterized protein n=1 Tax=Streptomyces somaliensis (strain ATCC 33201 / DSM 40738 / JCM 12659 / KCTC 9044 / NCTC 11332 / NRRL B-12077 / IP 733) TaxID=1134445 RepID=A0AA44IDA4_STRE0|nr:hypothetical protein [Streptomyces somaliensis]MCQ0023557.1 hypothetical protein [Streptomyces somaliensis DSM 40738]NKY14514.1 hypothetical protein [Streptomyces somaliensis DSM 40738]